MKTEGRNVLIIEDNRVIANALYSILQKANYTPEIFYTLDGASRYFDTFNESNVNSIAGIIFDYILDEASLITSVSLVIKMKRIQNFAGILFANSPEDSGNRHLLSVGCTHVRREANKIQAGFEFIRLLQK